jgi:putative PIN family toxin of toxin-antitoxin system
VLDLWANDRIELVVSPSIMEEYERILARMDRKMPERADFWRLFIAQYSTIVEAPSAFRICRDPKDDMFLDCAVAAVAKYVISGDKDLLTLKNVSGVEILSPATFLSRLGV